MLGLEGRLDERPAEPAIERLDPVDAAIGVITAPSLSMRAIALARAWPVGLAIYIAIALLNGFAGLTGRRQVPAVGNPEVSRAFETYFDAVQSPLGVHLNALFFTPLLLLIGTGILSTWSPGCSAAWAATAGCWRPRPSLTVPASCGRR